MKNLIVNQETCIGCGTCVSLAQKSFKLNDAGKSQPINPPADDEATIKNAIDSCPVKAITWQEEK